MIAWQTIEREKHITAPKEFDYINKRKVYPFVCYPTSAENITKPFMSKLVEAINVDFNIKIAKLGKSEVLHYFSLYVSHEEEPDDEYRLDGEYTVGYMTYPVSLEKQFLPLMKKVQAMINLKSK